MISKNLVGLYRVQDAEGRGPYTAIPDCSPAWRATKSLNGHTPDNGRPHPGADGLDDIANAWPLIPGVFACTSLRALESWFTPTELRSLALYGFGVVRLWVPWSRVEVGRCGRQAYVYPEGWDRTRSSRWNSVRRTAEDPSLPTAMLDLFDSL